MKRLFSFSISILIILIVLFIAGGCRRDRQVRGNDGRITVTSLTFPSYDFVRAIAGDKVNLNLLASPGLESHSFEPSPRDIISIRDSDLFIYPGGEGEGWLHRIFEAAGITAGSGPKILRMLDMVDGLEEEFVEGMEVSHSHDHHHDHDHHDYHDDDDYDHDDHEDHDHDYDDDHDEPE